MLIGKREEKRARERERSLRDQETKKARMNSLKRRCDEEETHLSMIRRNK